MKVCSVAKRQTSESYSVLGILEKALDYVRGQRKGGSLWQARN